MEEKKNTPTPIDLGKITKKIWGNRKTFYYVLPSILVATYLIVVCIPRYYICSVSLAPEISNSSLSGSLGSLASSFGLNSSLGKLTSEDAIFAEIYPDVIQSKNFIAELMTIPVKTQEDNQTCSYYVYLRDRQKDPWWDSLTGKLRNWLKPSPKDSYEGKEKLSVFSLTKQQEDIFFSVQDKLKCTVNKKTNVVTITFKDQDPLVCATMADSTCQKLQDFIINYRTNKARVDYEYYKKLCDKSKLEYEQALHQYAASADAHTNAVMATYQSQVERLENNMQIKYNIYTSMQAQLQAATAKLQETTPAFTVIESATIPHKPAGPKRVLIAIVVTILAFLVMTGWQLLKSRDITQ